MSRALLVLSNSAMKAKAVAWINAAEPGTRVEFKQPKRTTPQSDRMWAMLTDVSEQVEHFGRHYTPHVWKLLFLSELKRETKFVPSLDGSSVIPVSQSSSDLSKQEMSDLIEIIYARGLERGVAFHEPSTRVE